MHFITDLDEIKNNKMSKRILKRLYSRKYDVDFHYQLTELRRLQIFFNEHSNLNPKTIEKMEENKKDINILINNYLNDFENLQITDELENKFQTNKNRLEHTMGVGLGVLALSIFTSFIVVEFRNILIGITCFTFGLLLRTKKDFNQLKKDFFNKQSKEIEFIKGGWARQNYKIIDLD